MTFSSSLEPAWRVQVAVALPQHAGLDATLDYLHPEALPPGQLVRVPLGRREVLGVVWACEREAEVDGGQALKAVQAVLPLAPLDSGWRRLVAFAAAYYQRGLGEFALQALPVGLHQASAASLQRPARRIAKRASNAAGDPVGLAAVQPPVLNAAQQAAVAAVCAQLQPGCERPPLLLWGVTGSGKTEVYLHAAEQALARGLQVLVLVPEINLTPQLEARFAARFGAQSLVTLHSGLTPARRLRHWLAAHRGEAQLVLGTRLAVLASMPRLGLIVVDEEHDASFKAQDGARHSARDLAVLRAAQAQVPVLLGSATPSLETWHHALPGRSGRYRRLDLPERVNAAPLPAIRLLDTSRLPRTKGMAQPPIAPQLIEAIEQRRARGEQSLLLLNRRGYAPVLQCGACAWKSDCPHCSAWRVFHKSDRTLRCHHCGYTDPVPQRCPDCGNADILPVGRGTERLAEQIGQWLPEARVLRLDADTTRAVGSLEAQLAQVHAGEVDVVVGTQMIAKGHDFRRVSLVAALNPDTLLYSSDFRAPERLFALLLQAAGRAGRAGGGGEVWIQTGQPQHPLFQALLRSDYAGFAAQQLEERQAAGLPPFAHLALLRADSREALQGRDFLNACAEAGQQLAPDLAWYPPVPHPVARVANQWRWQMLVESPHRPPLQRALQRWLPEVLQLARQHRGVLRWAIDVDPSAI